jgi:hypothetical protein|tara:strand:- start:263 stop:1378 length:1116 start_codon:yes stop_codon:yes gene_type:complete
MKIGILTLPIAENYGGILQAIALYSYLHNQKHDVVLIYKDTKPAMWKKIIRSILLKIPFHDFKNIKTSDNRAEWKKRKDFHRIFIEQTILNISKDLTNTKELMDFARVEKFDAVIVGSDQVWAITQKSDKYYKNYFLDFIEKDSKTKKIAYAASFGKRKISDRQELNEIFELLDEFVAVSSREKSGVMMCEDILNSDSVAHVLDPTFLMDKDFYLKELISEHNTDSDCKKYLVTYILDPGDDKLEIIKNTQEEINCHNVTHLKQYNCSNIIYTVPQWLESFSNAEFIITDSFHGMVFSIIFQKDFLVIGNRERGIDRFTSLLSILNLEDRMIYSRSDLLNKNIRPIDYKKIDSILDCEKSKSKGFLDSALK